MTGGTLTLTHAAATWFLTGLIWTVQVVHYPLFARVGAAGYRDYQQAHQSLITLAVGPVMLVEAAACVLLLVQRRDPLTIAAAALLAVIWLSTALVQVPLHNELGNGFDPLVHARLVQSNWIRTIAWTLRAGIALLLLRATE
jgi:hypothetical protein